MNIIKAEIQHIDDLIPLFDGYRKFYRQQSDFVGAKHFLQNRINNEESTIYISYIEGKAAGFMQLFPIFSSVSMERMLLLNDLYVESNYRGQGVGSALIDVAKGLCVKNNYKGMALQTETDNPAQKLYEFLNFKKDPDLHYFWTNENR